MKEILGNNLKLFFDLIDKNCDQADIAYAGSRYEVWEVSDELYKEMCDMTEEQFVELAGEDAWWRSSDGSNLWAEDVIEFEVNGKEMIGWDSPIYSSKKGHKYENLSEYLCECIGASLPKNVCACAIDLAKMNDMTMGELFSNFEGRWNFMIKVFETNNTEYLQCNSCLVSNKEDDIFKIIVGKDYRRTTCIKLCKECMRDLKAELNNLEVNGMLM